MKKSQLRQIIREEIQRLSERVTSDPTYSQMFNFLQRKSALYHELDEFDMNLAIYFYAEANHEGQSSNLYKALSSVNNMMRIKTTFSQEPKDSSVRYFVSDLVDKFGGEEPE